MSLIDNDVSVCGDLTFSLKLSGHGAKSSSWEGPYQWVAARPKFLKAESVGGLALAEIKPEPDLTDCGRTLTTKANRSTASPKTSEPSDEVELKASVRASFPRNLSPRNRGAGIQLFYENWRAKGS